MDELFLLPPAVAAMPRSYWEAQPKLSSQLLLLQPSEHEFNRVQAATNAASNVEYDMEILNTLYINTALVLPHKVYDVLSSEFKPQKNAGSEESAKHENYLGDSTLAWDPDLALKTAKFVHFSEWPLPKPWSSAVDTSVEDVRTLCMDRSWSGSTMYCREGNIWVILHDDFRRRRKEVCGLDPSSLR